MIHLFLFCCRFDFARPDAKVMVTTFHWHAHGVANVCFTSDGEQEFRLQRYCVYTCSVLTPNFQGVTCCLEGKSRCWSSGSSIPTRSSSDLVLVGPSLSLPVAMVIATSLFHCRAMVRMNVYVRNESGHPSQPHPQSLSIHPPLVRTQ